jgi:hypothetical protein
MPPTPTAVLVVTSLIDETANTVIRVLIEREVRVVRIDPADIGTALTFSAHIGNGRDSWGGRLLTPSRDVSLEEIGATYYRRPSPWRSDAADEQVRQFVITEARHGLRGLLRTLPNCRYVNHPAATEGADFKVAQLQAAVRVGMNIVPGSSAGRGLSGGRDMDAADQCRRSERVIVGNRSPVSEGDTEDR